MKRKLFSLALTLLLLLALSITAFASEPDFPWVVDRAGLLTSQEISELTGQIQSLRRELELDIVIVTTYGTDGKGVLAYADDFYDQNGYGYGETNSGILLLVDMEAREWYISTCGDAIWIFTDYGLSQLESAFLPYLSEGLYYEAFETWIGCLEPYVAAYRSGSPVDGYAPPDDYESPYGEEIYHYDDHTGIRIRPFPIALVIGLAAAVITILVMRSQMNTAKFQNHAGDYLKSGSFRLHQHSDMFLHSHVSKTPRPKNNTSGGGSSVHRSSGGVSHGGRGGKF